MTRATVLLVDDETNILSALRRLFRPLGYRVLVATSGSEAMQVMEEERVNVVVCDMRMPGMDGLTFFDEAVRRWPAVARILLTGYSDGARTREAVHRGLVQHCLHKPWEADELKRIVAEVIDGAHSESGSASVTAGPAVRLNEAE